MVETISRSSCSELRRCVGTRITNPASQTDCTRAWSSLLPRRFAGVYSSAPYCLCSHNSPRFRKVLAAQRLVVPSTAYRAWVARVSAREEGECLFGSTELSVPAHKVIAQCTRTFVSHSDRSLGSGAWRIGNKNSPFGCRFSSVALGVSCFPPCSLLPLPAPGLPRDSGRLALNTTPSLLTSSPT